MNDVRGDVSRQTIKHQQQVSVYLMIDFLSMRHENVNFTEVQRDQDAPFLGNAEAA